MFLITSNKKSEGRRFWKQLLRVGSTPRKTSFFLKKLGNKSNVYHKKNFYSFLHTSDPYFGIHLPKWYYRCYDILTLKTRYTGVFKTTKGAHVVIPLVDAVSYGSKIAFLRNAYKRFFYITVGVLTRLKFLKLASLVSGVGYHYPTFARSMGTYCKLRLLKRKNLTLILPSGLWKSFTNFVSGSIGRNAGFRQNKSIRGKASEPQKSTLKIVVRSCAKNPVDHPNGGRTRGKMLFKTPWGKIAKKGK